jgi:hypothetical protein
MDPVAEQLFNKRNLLPVFGLANIFAQQYKTLGAKYAALNNSDESHFMTTKALQLEHPDRFSIPAKERQNEVLAVVRQGLGNPLGGNIEKIDINNTHQRVYSRVLDCNAHLSSGERQRIMIKIYEPVGAFTKENLQESIIKDFDITTQLDAHFSLTPRLRVPTPLFHSPEHLVIVTAHVPGQQLQEKLVRRAAGWPSRQTLSELETDCHTCGEWLREFQKAPIKGGAGGLDVEKMRDMIALRLDWLVADSRIPLGEATSKEILRHFDREVAALTPSDMAVANVHGDYFPGNVLVADNLVVGLDFANSRQGSVFADPSYFVFQLQTLTYKPQYQSRVIGRLQNSFLNGWSPGIPSEEFFTDRPILRMYCVFHYVMRLAGMVMQRNRFSWKQELYNWGVAASVSHRLRKLAKRY